MDLIPLYLKLVFIASVGALLWVVLAMGASAQMKRQDGMPVLTELARVIAKRLEIEGGGSNSSTRTHYYVTFEKTADGTRLELAVPAGSYGVLIEADTGYLTFRGDECLDFVRILQPETATAAAPEPEWVCGYCNGVVPVSESKCPACGSMRQAATSLPG